MDFVEHASSYEQLPSKFNYVSSRFLFSNVLRLERTRYFCFLHLNLTATSAFFFIWRQACRLFGSNDISVSDRAWHKDCSRTFLVKSDSTGLILTLFRIGISVAAHGWGGGGAKRPPSIKSVTHILQWWNVAQLYLT